MSAIAKKEYSTKITKGLGYKPGDEYPTPDNPYIYMEVVKYNSVTGELVVTREFVSEPPSHEH